MTTNASATPTDQGWLRVLARISAKWVRYLERAFLVAGGLFLLLWAFEPTRNALRDSGAFSNSSVLAATGLMLALTIRGLIDFQRGLDDVQTDMDQLQAELERIRAAGGAPIIEGGVGTIYPHLRTACVDAASRRGTSLRVLGLT